MYLGSIALGGYELVMLLAFILVPAIFALIRASVGRDEIAWGLAALVFAGSVVAFAWVSYRRLVRERSETRDGPRPPERA
jgi:membrane protein implicated in regulation of membrane protease activity